MKINLYTLSFNLFTETQKATERLYAQNEYNFKHYICDLGFPLIKGDEIPDSIQEAKEQNSESLKALCARFGSVYVKFENEGVSQNTSQIYKHINPSDEDVLVSCEPDEVQVENGWVNAMANALSGGLCFVAPHLIEHKDLFANSPYTELRTIGGEEVYVMKALVNFGQIGYSGRLLNKFGGVGVPDQAKIYGYLEGVLMNMVKESNGEWGILKNYSTIHTDAEKGTVGASTLLREWKNDSIYRRPSTGQIPFERWLIQKRDVVEK